MNKSLLSIFMMLLIYMIGRTQGVCMEDERRALVEIKASLHEYFPDVDNLLSTWVDHGSSGSECCEWERITCDTITGHVTGLSLSNVFSEDYESLYDRTWSLDFSPFIHFKELRNLDLSWNYIGDTFAGKGIERLLSLKKLETLNLSNNRIENNILPSLGSLTSLKILNLGHNREYDLSSSARDIFEFSTLENLEVLDLTGRGYFGTLHVQGSEKLSILKKLKILNLGDNYFNESLLTSLSVHQSLQSIDLSGNELGSIPFEEFSNLTNLKELDLSFNSLQETPSIQGCKSLKRLKNLESMSLVDNGFSTSIISCLSFLPSLKILNLSQSHDFGSSLPMRELSSLRELKTLDLSDSGFKSLPLNGTMSKLVYLSLDFNYFIDDIMMSMSAFPSLRYLSLEDSFSLEGSLGGTLFANGPPNLPYLKVLLLRQNGFSGTLPMDDLTYFHHLEVLDLSSNNFIGSISSRIQSLSSLKAISLAGNMLDGSLPDGLCKLKNLSVLDISHNNFHGSLPECFNRLSSLKLFDISSNQFTGMVQPSLIANLTYLEYVDFSHNNFNDTFSFSLFSNHTKLESVAFINDNDLFKVETEDPVDWFPTFQLKVLVLSNCNLRGTIPSFLIHQKKLEVLDMSYNSLEGRFPKWLIKNNTKLEVIHLGMNYFSGTFRIPVLYRNARITRFDVFGNPMTQTITRVSSISYLNLSRNSFNGVIPSSLGTAWTHMFVLDLSHNNFSGEVPKELLTNSFDVLKLSNNSLHGEILSGNISLGSMANIFLDNNCFTGKIGNDSIIYYDDDDFSTIDISNNFFTGSLPIWISNITGAFVARNNRLGGHFPCGTTSLSFLDISQNYFSRPIPSCLNLQSLEHLHMGSNRFTGSIPKFLGNLTYILTLSISNNSLSGRIPEFLGELSYLRILLLGKNNFSGPIPKELCQLTNASLIDLSSNSLSGSIPNCLQNITGPSYLAYEHIFIPPFYAHSETVKHMDIQSKVYRSVIDSEIEIVDIQDEVQFTTKRMSLPYTGTVLYLMSGLDLSCNKLTGDIPQELGSLTKIHVLNLSHNQLTGSIPVNFSKLSSIESLDLSFNSLTGEIPSELIELNSLEVFNVSFNNLSGRLPEMKAQFGTFSKESYRGNPLLCGPPLENKCVMESNETHQSYEEGSGEKWYDMDMTFFCGSFGSTWFVFMLGFAAVLYINPRWRNWWLNLIEECMYTCYYFLYDSARNVYIFFRN